MRVVLVAVAALLAWWLVRMLARRMGSHTDAPVPKLAGALFTDAFFVGLLAARLGYVVRWWPEYAAAPWSILAIGDGGFLWRIGLPAAIAFTWWRSARQGRLRKPLFAGIAAGLLAWFALNGTLALLQHSVPSLPDIATHTLDGIPTTLDASAGRPIVLNLWATWCPPCRREMPVLEQAQTAFPDVAFVLVNQGESAQQARAYLESEGLNLTDVLLDPSSEAMREMRTGGLPTTFFFDAQGRMVDLHLGEITMADLESKISRHF